MMTNLDKSIMRGQKIELTLAKTDTLLDTSMNYKGTALAVKRDQRKRYYMILAASIGASIVSNN